MHVKAAVVGATGPVGRRLVPELADRGVEVRAVSRSRENLERDFGGRDVELLAADVGDPESARRAAEGCDLLVHAVGVPVEAFDRHLPLARTAVEAAEGAGARSFLVTSYWCYGPGDEGPMREDRGRRGDSSVAEIRERQERMFLEVGGAVARLPDFFGPEPGASVMNDALESLASGATVTWPGDPDAPRDFLFHPDAGRFVAELALEEGAYGEAWNLPGSGARAPRDILRRAAELAGRDLKVRRIRRWMARVAAIFDREVRAFLDVMPLYEAPVVLDTSKIEELLGPLEPTPYGETLRETLDRMEAAT